MWPVIPHKAVLQGFSPHLTVWFNPGCLFHFCHACREHRPSKKLVYTVSQKLNSSCSVEYHQQILNEIFKWKGEGHQKSIWRWKLFVLWKVRHLIELWIDPQQMFWHLCSSAKCFRASQSEDNCLTILFTWIFFWSEMPKLWNPSSRN